MFQFDSNASETAGWIIFQVEIWLARKKAIIQCFGKYTSLKTYIARGN